VAATATGVVGGVVGAAVWTVTPEMLTSDVLGADSAGASLEARTTRALLLTEVSCTLDRADLRSIIADMFAECVWEVEADRKVCRSSARTVVENGRCEPIYIHGAAGFVVAFVSGHTLLTTRPPQKHCKTTFLMNMCNTQSSKLSNHCAITAGDFTRNIDARSLRANVFLAYLRAASKRLYWKLFELFIQITKRPL